MFGFLSTGHLTMRRKAIAVMQSSLTAFQISFLMPHFPAKQLHIFCLCKFKTYCQFSHRTVNRMQDVSVAFPLLQNIRMFSRAGTPHVKAIIQDIFTSRMTTWGSHAFFFPYFNFCTCSFKERELVICKRGGRGPFLPRTWLSRKVQHSEGIISTFCPWNQIWISVCIYSTAAGLEVVNP